MAIVVVLGLLAIVYARESRPSDGSGVPRVNDGANIDAHWHAAFGIYICDTFQPKIIGTRKRPASIRPGSSVLLNDKFKILGVHSHERRRSSTTTRASTKSSAIAPSSVCSSTSTTSSSTDSELVMPPEQGGEKWSTDDTKCDGKDTQINVRVWDRFDNPNVHHDVVTDFNNIRITNDGMVFVVAVVPKGADIPMPDWAAELPTLGAADGGAVIATTSTTPTGDSTVPARASRGDTTVGRRTR